MTKCNDARTKLLQNPLPVDRVAARVVKSAKPESIWRPMPKNVPTQVFSATALETAPLPRSAPRELHNLAGKRRDRLVIVGYAKQECRSKNAAWVVRCDCGNFEHRTRIFRWLGTAAPDMCAECRNRIYKQRGEWYPRDAAERNTSATKALITAGGLA